MVVDIRHLELGIQEPLTDKVVDAVPMTHSKIAAETRKTQAEMITVFEEQVFKLYATLSTAWLSLVVLRKKFPRTKDRIFHEDSEKIKEDLFNSKAGIGDLLQKPDLYMFVDKHGNKIPKDKPFEAFIKREKAAYRVLSSYDSFSRRYADKFQSIEDDVEKQTDLIRKIESLNLISRISVLRAQNKDKDIKDRATVLYYIIEQLCALEERGAKAYLVILKGELTSLEIDEVNDYLKDLERRNLEQGK